MSARARCSALIWLMGNVALRAGHRRDGIVGLTWLTL